MELKHLPKLRTNFLVSGSGMFSISQKARYGILLEKSEVRMLIRVALSSVKWCKHYLRKSKGFSVGTVVGLSAAGKPDSNI